MRMRAVLFVLALAPALAGCYGCPGDPDTGWCCNRPVRLPCCGCTTLIPDPITFGRDCGPQGYCPDLPGRLVTTVRYSDPSLPPVGYVKIAAEPTAAFEAEPQVVVTSPPPPPPPVEAPPPVPEPEPEPAPDTPQ
jgi:hypothetical protein